MIKAALFDLGGTLLDFNPENYAWLEWERIGVQAVCAFLSSRGHPIDPDAFAGHFMGALTPRWIRATEGKQNLRLGDLLAESSAACGTALSEDEIQQAVALYIAPLDARVVMYDDARETLQALADRGLRIGLISNTMWPGDYHRRELERFGLLSYFDDTLFSGDVGLWKPQPAAYGLALERLGVSAEDAFFVGDLPQHDLLGAQAVGMRTVFKRNKSFELAGVQPDAEITHLIELTELINRWSS